MPKFTPEELKSLKKPYDVLGQDSAILTENHDALDSMPSRDKIALATNMVLACPKAELEALRDNATILQRVKQPQDCFQTMLTNAIRIRLDIHKMADENTDEPHALLTGSTFNADLFNQFNKLTTELVNQEATAMASNLAIKTPVDKSGELQKNIRSAFSQTTFAGKFGEAMVLTRTLKGFRGPNPYHVLRDPDFNPALFPKFPALITYHFALLEPLVVARKLADEKWETYELTSKKLNQLVSAVNDKEHPVALILAEFQKLVEKNQQHIVKPVEIVAEIAPVENISLPPVESPLNTAENVEKKVAESDVQTPKSTAPVNVGKNANSIFHQSQESALPNSQSTPQSAISAFISKFI